MIQGYLRIKKNLIKTRLDYLRVMFWEKRTELRSMPSMTLFVGGLAPANDSDVVNKSINVPSWWLTWQHKKITHLRK